MIGNAFTPREQEIAAALLRGASNREIAAAFGISTQTVKNHLTSMFEKRGVTSRLQLALALQQEARFA